MTKQEFLEQLRRTLASRVGSVVVNENIAYYEEYIVTQVRAGKREEEVIEELGDPRLLARSIADASKRAGASEENREAFEEEQSPMQRIYKLPGWLIFTIVLLLVILVLSAVFSVLGVIIRALFPILFPIAIVVFFLRFLQRK